MFRKSIYLSGPEVFLPNAIEIGKQKKEICQKYGYIGIYPLDNEIEDQESKIETAIAISQMNEALIRDCDIILCNLSPFRSVSADVGTVYELGYARALGKYAHGYSITSLSYYDRVYEYDKNCKNGFDSNSYAIENFDGLKDNLMVHISLINGVFLAKNGSNLEVFEELLKKIS